MQCLYCGKPVGLLRELADGEFCSRDHRQRYKNLTQRAFGRLMHSRPQPAPFVAPPVARPEPPPPAPISPPPAGLLRLPVFIPEPGVIVARHEVNPAGPYFKFYTTLVAPTMPVDEGPVGLASACVRPVAAPVPVNADGAILAQTESVVFRVRPVTLPIVESQLRPVDLPLGAVREAVSHQPCLEPLVVAPQVQETMATRTPTNGVMFAAMVVKPSLGLAPLPIGLRACLPQAPHATDRADASLPEMKMAAAPEPQPWPSVPALPRLGLASLAAAMASAPPAASAAVQKDARFRPQAAPAIVPCRRPAQGPGTLPLASLAPLRPLSVQPRVARSAEAPVPGRGAVAFSASSVRMPQLAAASDRLALSAGEPIGDEVLGADVSGDPLVPAVKPSLGAGSVLPALASLFRYGRTVRSTPALPHLAERLNPHNRLAFPVAYKELPMPVQRPRVPRSSSLHIVETFEYLKPLGRPPRDLLQDLVRLWRAAPVYVRFAAVSASVILLLWAAQPGRLVGGVVTSRWVRMQQEIERRAAVELSEDFRDDMSQWTGSGDWAESWRISRAGYVRPGRLALYEPSMQMREYRVEFLMQIEQKAVGFAYRATDRENYYATKITLSKPGPLPLFSLVRWPVIGGREGPKVEVPIRVLLHDGTPYRVQLTVNDRGFSTSIEGQLVDFWTDDRLQAGGFGFFSDSGESARVYWMKLSHQNDFIGRVCAVIRQPAIPRRRTEIRQ